jgi:hypothetical protein
MTVLPTISFTLLFFFSFSTLGQTSCDTLNPERVKLYDSYTPKTFNKLQHKQKLDLSTAFEIATYFRLKDDTTYKQWYQLYIDRTKEVFKHSNQDKGMPANPLYYVAVSYYYTDNFVQADSWFNKAIKASYSSKCLDYYKKLTSDKLKEQNK